ncbi:MAG: hypothetical protein LKM39_03680 [Chiayiivirga sp.]|jgi:2-oxoglutarate dehydrogenase complex dehydrogenase (E1) component-like enzyme|nr:hypothetical protein [Chiayiivirga sp.]
MNQGAWYQIQHHLQRLPAEQADAALRRSRTLALARLRPPATHVKPNRPSWSKTRW